MRTLYISILILSMAHLAPPSCDELIETASNIAISSGESGTLSSNDIITGLKTALLVGTDSSVTTTSKLNGYYKDEAIKILLPPEAAIIYQNKDNALFRAVKLDEKIEDAILALNRAAEDAAHEAGPIFVDAIKNMTVSDGLSILKGKNPAAYSPSTTFDSTAATAYLRSTSYDQLRDAFAPKIKVSLDKKLMGEYSANQVWNGLTSNYNLVAKKSFGMIKPIENTNLSEYVTEKALDGLFLKVSDQEILIRRDPKKWASTAVGNILQKVFGQQNN
jgi:hypothetical protein